MTPEEIAAAEAEALRLKALADAIEETDEAKEAATLAATKAQTAIDKVKQEILDKAALDAAKLTDPQAEALKEIMKWKTKAREAEARAKLFEGIDPVKAKSALEAHAAAERKELEARGEYDRIIAQINTQHGTELASVVSERDALKAQIEELTSSGKKKDVANAFANSVFVRDNLTISGAKVQVLFGDHFGTNTDNELVGYDKPTGASERTPLVDGQGKPLSFEAALEKIVKADPEFANMAKSSIKKGPGSTTNNLNPSQIPVTLNSSTDKIREGLKTLKKKPLTLPGR